MDARESFLSIGELVVAAVRDLSKHGQLFTNDRSAQEATTLQLLFGILLTLPAYAVRRALVELSREPLVLPVPGGKAIFEFRYLRDLQTNAIGGWELPCLELMRAVVQRGATVLDIGAHVGFHSILAAELVGPEGRVFAFEPAPDNRRRLERNLKLNELQDHIRVMRAAVCDRPSGTAQFFYSDGGTNVTGYTILPPHSHCEPVFEAEATSIDAFVEAEGIESLDFVKIDVEGAELQALRGASNSLEKHADVLLLVALHSAFTSPEECCRYLEDRGFWIYDVEGGLKPLTAGEAKARFIGSGSVFATRRPVEIA